MFSRTWQLRAIYYIQKKDFAALKNISTTGAMVKALVSVGATIIVDFILLLSWTIADPYTAQLQILDDDRLLGKWACTSNHIAVWVSLQAVFLGIILLWGVFVIYETWAFQRKSVILETKWVLMALYNVVLNGAILIPFLSFISTGDDDIALAVIISVDFSAGGILLAALGPSLFSHYFSPSKGSKSNEVRSKSGSHSDRLEISTRVTRKVSHQIDHLDMSEKEIQLLVVPKPLSLSGSMTPEELNPSTDSMVEQNDLAISSTDNSRHENPLVWTQNPITPIEE